MATAYGHWYATTRAALGITTVVGVPYYLVVTPKGEVLLRDGEPRGFDTIEDAVLLCREMNHVDK